MATANTDLSNYDAAGVPSGAGLRLGLVVSVWNAEITDALRDGAVETLLKHGSLHFYNTIRFSRIECHKRDISENRTRFVLDFHHD